ncbi:DUF2892 domain-containing protein [Bacillus songklensis]|uniref:DUF2892 domain-containing protein n=1 Tax=Bacillus songklensis TaxID=1069116 RepID=A0ABV8B5G9_9BACI
MKPNIGIINALVRITFGFTVLTWATARLAKRPYRESYLLAAMMGAMKVGEGITRFCPLTFLYDKYQQDQQQQQIEQESSTFNPS